MTAPGTLELALRMTSRSPSRSGILTRGSSSNPKRRDADLCERDAQLAEHRVVRVPDEGHPVLGPTERDVDRPQGADDEPVGAGAAHIESSTEGPGAR